jgi:ribose-phosphate pyrophosphokinase
MTDFNEDLFHRINTAPAKRISTRQFLFPGGEVGINVNVLEADLTVKDITLSARVSSSDKLMGMFMATDALERVYPNANIHLQMPYIPYARQDRVCNAGEALSIKAVARLINAQNYATVSVVDPHSPTAVALIDRVQVKDQFDVFGKVKQDWSNWTIVAPDMGASKKVEEFAKRVGAKGVVCFNKTRELATGKITGMNCLDPLEAGGKYFVLDDICDGGRTFIELAQHFNLNHQTVELAVTHGIFSAGVERVTEQFDMVHTTNSFHGGLLPHAGLNIIKV